ncbi:radical SAM protein [Hyalangium sp.]|uniref:radical SAM protein n=1 Tax=Hyalangium sp. TaxID=2028555 RepID=UPI002D4030F8|nr:radical SAM protein [Hyalangium sp.]HYI00668.1 radical SAM protein [Hyalangium sp.]
MSQAVHRRMDFVVKVSKFCNLRCRYCYEYESLGNREAMSREQLRQLYRHIEAWRAQVDARDQQRTELGFIWHGGEPLLLEPGFYWDTLQDQKEIFGEDVPRKNVLQTNLTVLDEERIELLRRGFDVVGVSVDVFGGLRVNVAGKDLQPQTLKNMERLRERGVPFSTITVLTRANIGRLRHIYDFFSRAGIDFRLLPLFDGAFEGQHRSFDMSTQDILKAFQELVDLWLEKDGFLKVYPTLEQIQTVLRFIKGNAAPVYYNKREWLPVLLVNTNGDCFTYGDPYEDPEWCVGNLFTTPLVDLFAGERFAKSALAAERRIAQNCLSCPYFGACSGYPIAEEHYNFKEKRPDGGRTCVVERNLFAYIEKRIRAQQELLTDERVEAAFREQPAA